MILEAIILSTIHINYDRFEDKTTIRTDVYTVATHESHPDYRWGNSREIVFGLKETLRGKSSDLSDREFVHIWIGEWGDLRQFHPDVLFIVYDDKQLTLERDRSLVNWSAGKKPYTFPSGLTVNYNFMLSPYKISAEDFVEVSTSHVVEFKWNDCVIPLENHHKNMMTKFINP